MVHPAKQRIVVQSVCSSLLAVLLCSDCVAAERFERRPEDRDRHGYTLGQREGRARSEWQPGDGAAAGDFVLEGSGNREAQEREVPGGVVPGLQGSRGSERPRNAIQERRSRGDLP
ncbi:MAG: hypothetical protein HQM06_15100 [Magnetococcales bacterium]|nr:hypothetical protein [Magnetococcales bacterium]